MKLIQQLERKLSWRKKPNEIVNYSNKIKKNSTVKVIDSEFSQYIHFNTSTENEWPATDVNPTYEIVNIRPRVNIHQNIQLLCNNQPSSPGREEDFDVHIYHNIDDLRPTFVRCLKDNSFVSSAAACANVSKRNRIRTNPWFNSWSKKDTASAELVPNETSNIYECVDKEDKENVKQSPYMPVMSTFAVPISPIKTSKPTCPKTTFSRKSALTDFFKSSSSTTTKLRTPPYYDPYPRSPLQPDNSDIVAPSPEFLTQSQQICNEISKYVSNNQLAFDELDCKSNKSNGVYQILDTSLETKVNDKTEDINNNSVCSISVKSYENPFLDQSNFENSSIEIGQFSPKLTSSPIGNKRLADHYYSKPIKRKRPNSSYSHKGSKRIDRLKDELEQIVIPAILAAQNEDIKQR